MFAFGILALAVMGCKSTDSSTEEMPNVEEIPTMTGGDEDAHGCKGSAGYMWSEVKKECVRTFEAGISFEATAENKDKTLAAFVIVSADKKQVEAFIPTVNKGNGVVLSAPTVREDLNNILFDNSKQNVQLVEEKDAYQLKVAGVALFKHPKKEGEGLSKALK